MPYGSVDWGYDFLDSGRRGLITVPVNKFRNMVAALCIPKA